MSCNRLVWAVLFALLHLELLSSWLFVVVPLAFQSLNKLFLSAFTRGVAIAWNVDLPLMFQFSAQRSLPPGNSSPKPSLGQSSLSHVLTAPVLLLWSTDNVIK